MLNCLASNVFLFIRCILCKLKAATAKCIHVHVIGVVLVKPGDRPFSSCAERLRDLARERCKRFDVFRVRLRQNAHVALSSFSVNHSRSLCMCSPRSGRLSKCG